MGTSIGFRGLCIVLLATFIAAKPRPADYTPTGVQPPDSPPYNVCRDRCVPGGIISGTGCVTFQDFPFNGDWSVFGASTWSCICVRARLGGFSAVSARGCAFSGCGYMIHDMDNEFNQNCTDAAERYNGTISTSITTKDPPPITTTESTTGPTSGNVSTKSSTVYLPSSYTNATTSGVSTNPPTVDPMITDATSVVYTTQTNTITSCPAGTISCSIGLVVTETIALYTTTCPVVSVQESINPHSPFSNSTKTTSRWKPSLITTTDAGVSTDTGVSTPVSPPTITLDTEGFTSPTLTGQSPTSSTLVAFTGQGIHGPRKSSFSMIIAMIAVLFGI